MVFLELLLLKTGQPTWFKRLEAMKVQRWNNIGIYNLIQLSKYDVVSLDMPMLMESFLF